MLRSSNPGHKLGEKVKTGRRTVTISSAGRMIADGIYEYETYHPAPLPPRKIGWWEKTVAKVRAKVKWPK